MAEYTNEYYQMTAEQALLSISSRKDGLTSQEAYARLTRDGPNELAQKKRKTDFEMFLEQFQSPMIMVLIAAAVISFVVSLQISLSPFSVSISSFTEVLDAIAIVAIVLLNAGFGFTQERSAEKAIEALKKMVAPTATVIRQGQKMRIPSKEIVVGDIVVLEEGDRVPADCRLLEVRSLEVDESALTGESMPVLKETGQIRDAGVPLAERKNMAFMSTVVTRGRATAVAVSCGMATEIGKISELVQSAEDEETPLSKKLASVATNLGYVAIAASALVFVLGILSGKGLFEMFLTTISIAVAAIPEGLPAIVTLSLALGVSRMAKKNAIVRKLAACETLGSATVICTDKTGTITKNEMTAKAVFAAGEYFDVTGSGYAEQGKVHLATTKTPASLDGNEAYKMTAVCAAACNNAKLVQRVGGEIGIIGDPMEAALLVLARKAGQDRDTLEMEYAFEDENPFDSNRKLMSTLWKKNGQGFLFVKGAPEKVLERCTQYCDAKGGLHPLSAKDREGFLSANKAYASRALRVLAFAYKKTDSKHCDETIERELVFSGLVGLLDPAREEIPHAIEVCKQAGIRVVMITGDNADTAAAIARSVGLAGPDDRVVTGKELDAMSEQELLAEIYKIAVYARVDPAHKLRIVSAFRARGEIVAMTGDGVNDAPALKKADIGIAMGISGTEVAKEAGDMVLADDNFTSIVAAVEEGRVIYDNIVKAVHFLVASNVGEVLVLLIALLLNMPFLPLLPLQILWINLVSDGLPALALGSDSPESGLMKRKPRPREEEIFGLHILPVLLFDGIIIAAGTLALFMFALENNYAEAEARTIAFTTLVFLELIYAFTMRSMKNSMFSIRVFGNTKMVLALVLGILSQLAIIYLPAMNGIFDTAPLPILDLTGILLCALLIIPVVELRKWIMRKRASARMS
ncbi:MAG: HAD-IC family P-type ATPase [Candidatus Micrarchaeia archaeon]